VQCDFSSLLAGVLLNDKTQREKLIEDCGIIVSALDLETGEEKGRINVFDSSNIASEFARDDPDLGSPNKACPGGGPGVGDGGKPDAAFPNCSPQGNLLIIQNRREDAANDSPFGGCISVEFIRYVELADLGLLDLEEVATIKVRNERCRCCR
jgi:hypothetical protein